MSHIIHELCLCLQFEVGGFTEEEFPQSQFVFVCERRQTVEGPASAYAGTSGSIPPLRRWVQRVATLQPQSFPVSPSHFYQCLPPDRQQAMQSNEMAGPEFPDFFYVGKFFPNFGRQFPEKAEATQNKACILACSQRCDARDNFVCVRQRSAAPR